MSNINGCKNKSSIIQQCINIYKQADYLEMYSAYFEVTKDDGRCQDLFKSHPEYGPN